MSQCGLLERFAVTEEDAWIDVVPAGRAKNSPAGSSVLEAIFAARSAVSRGVVRQVSIDIDELPAIDELDDAAIRAFFGEND